MHSASAVLGAGGRALQMCQGAAFPALLKANWFHESLMPLSPAQHSTSLDHIHIPTRSQDLLVPFGTFSDPEHILWYVHLLSKYEQYHGGMRLRVHLRAFTGSCLWLPDWQPQMNFIKILFGAVERSGHTWHPGVLSTSPNWMLALFRLSCVALSGELANKS